MDDYENDGRDYNENIDEGPTDEENEFNLFTKKSNTTDTKSEGQGKTSADLRRGRPCHCKDTKKRKMKKNRTNSTNNGNDVNGTNGTGDKKDKKNSKDQNNKKVPPKNIQRNAIAKNKGKRGRKKKERRLVNPFIIFYLEMYYKNPTKCVAEIASEAGRLWSKMSAKEKAEYINKARVASAKSKMAKLESKRLKKSKNSKRMRKDC